MYLDTSGGAPGQWVEDDFQDGRLCAVSTFQSPEKYPSIEGIRANPYVNLGARAKTDIMAMKPGQCRTTLWLADLHQIQTMARHILTQFGCDALGICRYWPQRLG